MTVGNNLIAKIKDKGWTIKSTAEKAKIPLPTINNILYGTSEGSVSTLNKLAKALDCTVDDLVVDSEVESKVGQDLELLKECLSIYDEYIKQKGLKFSREKSMKIVDNLVSLYSKKKEKGLDYKVDQDTIEWIIENL